jgi:exopolysaccharide biosynthesis polyprenyl glycosylphosphotransferase
VIFDALAIVVAWLISFAVSPTGAPDLMIPAIALAVVLGLIALTASRLYRARVSVVRSTEFARLGPVAFVAASPAIFLPMLLHREENVAASIFLVLSLFLILMVERSVFDAWLRGRRSLGFYCRRLLIVGTANEARDLSVLLNDHAELGYRIVGFVGPDPEGDVLPAGSPWLGGISATLPAVKEVRANGVLIASDAVPADQLGPLVRKLSRHGVHTHLSGGLWGLDHRRIHTLPIAHEPLFYIEPLKLGQFQSTVKRLLDIVGGCVLFAVSLPIVAVAAVLIRLGDGGPVLFRQRRVGLGGSSFELLKLRTMTDDPEIRSGATPVNGREGPLFKALESDPRVTRVGHLLRRTSIDELPQLLNVIRGEMSLVGPRPALQSEIDNFDDELLNRHNLRPGITGLWQVEARDNPSFRPYRRLDLFYVDNWSLMLDLVILMQTVPMVAMRALRSGDERPELIDLTDGEEPADAAADVDVMS